MATTHLHPSPFPTVDARPAARPALGLDARRDDDARQAVPPSFPPAAGDDERDGWRTSTAPAAVSVALLTGMAMAVALGLREVVAMVASLVGGA